MLLPSQKLDLRASLPLKYSLNKKRLSSKHGICVLRKQIDRIYFYSPRFSRFPSFIAYTNRSPQ